MRALSGRSGAAGPATWRPGRGGILRRLRRDDRGGVATVFGVLLAGGVLLGMLALVVDVGQLYVEREELQSGADAVAIAAAKSCAADADACNTSDLTTTTSPFAGGNARDGATNFTICGSVPGVSSGGLPSCDATTAPRNLTRCLDGAALAAGQPYLEVHTSTEESDGSTLLPPSFARALLGNEDYEGTTVGACARVSWGAPKAGLAVTFSKCEWDDATRNGEHFPAPPPYPPNAEPSPADEYEIVLRTHDAKDPDSLCPDEKGPPGWDQPGGFGWLDDDGAADCTTETFTAGPTGVTEKNCTDVLDPVTTDASSAKVFYLPIYDEVYGTGSNAKYHIIGMAAFVPTGYFFGSAGGKRRESWLTAREYCTGEDRCIYGYFVDVLQPGPVEIGPLDPLGATIVSLIG
ncbi:Tad domain-containing protein [Micromonospora sp. NPDC048930]|uniref:Tad domain-containing protein n=1 Tax=Micromonospora sp. NPDC048930 TaxID=3364261 RepID=UPI003716CD96